MFFISWVLHLWFILISVFGCVCTLSLFLMMFSAPNSTPALMPSPAAPSRPLKDVQEAHSS